MASSITPQSDVNLRRRTLMALSSTSSSSYLPRVQACVNHPVSRLIQKTW